MAREVVVPPRRLDVDGPLVFLAGPIQGAPLWQDEAVRVLGEIAPWLHVANPRRPDFKPSDYDEQVDWETRHLRLAGKRGVVMFWLAAEAEHLCERAYAQTTRFELAEWKLRHERDGARIVVGADAGFTNLRYIRRRMRQDCPGVPVLDSIEGCCRLAAELARTA